MGNFIKELFIRPTERIGHQYVRYVFVGGTAFVLDFLLLVLLTEFLSWHYLFSASLSFIIGSIYNYELSVRWIFPTRKIVNRKVEFMTFILIGVSGLLLNAGIIYVCTAWIGLFYLVSKIISGVIVFSWNFIIRKVMLFS